MDVPVEDFVRTMARVPGPVTVVTTVDPQGRSWGFTASSFSSLSLRPPLVLVCLDKMASTHAGFMAASHFLVNVLAEGQADVALRFARSGSDRFAAGDTRPCELGLPGVPHACARLACSRYQVIDVGDHSILVGRVHSVHAVDDVALAYCAGAFARVTHTEFELAGKPHDDDRR
jgi:flavin reductase (DIM6/NTAB) family NADH-FMN oxidoreductase RutF